MIKALFVVGLMAASVSAGPFGVPQKMVDHLAGWTFNTACWGKANTDAFHDIVMDAIKECQKMPTKYTKEDLLGPMAGLPRAARQAETDPEKKEMMMMFMDSLEGLKEAKTHVLGNISCTMHLLGKWNEDNTVKIETYTKTKWDLMPEPMPEDFKNDLVMKYEMCNDFVNAIPAPEVEMAPFKKMFGKAFMFNKCAHKVTQDMCAKKLIADWLEEEYGEHSEAKAIAMGLPPNKYEASYIALKAMKFGMPKTMKMVKKFVFTGKK